MEKRVYGFVGSDLHELASQISKLLSIPLASRYSDFLGGEYYIYESGFRETFWLGSNFNFYDETWAEPDFKTCTLLFYIIRNNRQVEIEDIIKLRWKENVWLIKVENEIT